MPLAVLRTVPGPATFDRLQGRLMKCNDSHGFNPSFSTRDHSRLRHPDSSLDQNFGDGGTAVVVLLWVVLLGLWKRSKP